MIQYEGMSTQLSAEMPLVMFRPSNPKALFTPQNIDGAPRGDLLCVRGLCLEDALALKKGNISPQDLVESLEVEEGITRYVFTLPNIRLSLTSSRRNWAASIAGISVLEGLFID